MVKSFDIPKIKSVAEIAFEDLIEKIRDFQDNLPDDMEVGIVANGGGTTLHVESIAWGHTISFDGTDAEGRKARLIQHYTQINVQMIAVPKLDAEARRIGF